jgi:hypothetical protein
MVVGIKSAVVEQRGDEDPEGDDCDHGQADTEAENYGPSLHRGE